MGRRTVSNVHVYLFFFFFSLHRPAVWPQMISSLTYFHFCMVSSSFSVMSMFSDQLRTSLMIPYRIYLAIGQHLSLKHLATIPFPMNMFG